MTLPLCFVLVPFGRKTIPSDTTVDFDAIYQDLIAPAISEAGDGWDDACNANDAFATAGWLARAIETYLQGFEADWHHAYPAINSVTLILGAGNHRPQSGPDPQRPVGARRYRRVGIQDRGGARQAGSGLTYPRLDDFSIRNREWLRGCEKIP